MVEKPSSQKDFFTEDGTEATPVSVKYERDLKIDHDFEASERKTKFIDFEAKEDEKDVEITVICEPGSFIAWKEDYQDYDNKIVEMIPWNRVLKVHWGFLEDDSDE